MEKITLKYFINFPRSMEEVGSYKLLREGDKTVMRINCLGCPYGASLEGSDECMSRTIDKLLEAKDVDRIILAEAYENEYGLDETRMLREVANIIETLIQSKIVSYKNLGDVECQKLYPNRAYVVQKVLLDQIRRDPLGAYMTVLNEIKKEKINLKKAYTDKQKQCTDHYIKNVLTPIFDLLERSELVQKAKGIAKKITAGDRSLYNELFAPVIRPNFTLTRFMATPPVGGEEIDQYYIGEKGNKNIVVRIYKLPGKVESFYHIMPPEFNLPQDRYTILGAARQIMAGHKPLASGFSEKTRRYFERVGKDLVGEIASEWNVDLKKKETEELAKILVRYTAGLGIMETLLYDEKLQDVYINAPIGEYPIRALHADWLEVVTNLIPTKEDAEAMAARFRLESGRPLDEANPVLDTEAEVPGGRARVAVIGKNLSPKGLAFTFRRHRDKPWTYPLFIDNKMMSPLAAGLLKFLIDHGRCLLFAGPRSSGKTSLVSATLVEIMRKYRIITIEDTLELPVDALRKMGYNILGMKVQSAITKLEAEMPADEGIRTALRLGDSCLIVGEVRSLEAKALYEAMRVGALSNVVAGTIHGDSAYGVFDRVVHDLEVAPTSFKATDMIILSRPVSSPDGLSRFRRIINLTEVKKEWVEDPLREGGFSELMKYDSAKDVLEPTEALLSGKSELLNSIAKEVRGWSGQWDNVWDNIRLRAEIAKTLVDYKQQYNLPQIIEADFVIQSNDMFHNYSREVEGEFGSLVSDEIYSRWSGWLVERLKHLR